MTKVELVDVSAGRVGVVPTCVRINGQDVQVALDDPIEVRGLESYGSQMVTVRLTLIPSEFAARVEEN